MNIAIVLSGGTGSRMGLDVPKQYIEVGGKPIIIYSMSVLELNSNIDAIQIVADEEWTSEIKSWCDKYEVASKIRGYSNPGANRQLSIYNALRDIKKYAKDNDVVIVHDAARPLVTMGLIDRSLDELPGYDGVIPVIPMKDTVYLSHTGDTIDSLLNRQEIFAGQAPETFVFGKYLAANQALVDSGEIEKINGSTEPAIKAGMKMHMIDGDERNFKITTKSDLARFMEMVKR
ncbi:MAG: 2-C-methyl-D-erythritol 4-phosphate cytidylyltransferase [Pseudobutyrivibrio sp.]|nr:2-C-methyl-D-erythritol 4-phosphate cytidylyltransferase [Pseudobutyrivibrio sp.]